MNFKEAPIPNTNRNKNGKLKELVQEFLDSGFESAECDPSSYKTSHSLYTALRTCVKRDYDDKVHVVMRNNTVYLKREKDE